jgi:hypothetical protein
VIERFDILAPPQAAIYEFGDVDLTRGWHYVWDWETLLWVVLQDSPAFQVSALRKSQRLDLPLKSFSDISSAWNAYQVACCALPLDMTMLTVLSRFHTRDSIKLGMFRTNLDFLNNFGLDQPPWFGPPPPPPPTSWARLLANDF